MSQQRSDTQFPCCECLPWLASASEFSLACTQFPTFHDSIQISSSVFFPVSAARLCCFLKTNQFRLRVLYYPANLRKNEADLMYLEAVRLAMVDACSVADLMDLKSVGLAVVGVLAAYVIFTLLFLLSLFHHQFPNN
ncbi:hypothetical protein BS78_02G137800 [Paspalum vaginatum]|nr:hypothetical protein BS78_02G137800 [Paspalum vaginatum]